LLILEQTPRLALKQLQRLESWDEIAQARKITITTGDDGSQVFSEIDLVTDRVPLGRRYWMSCPKGCGGKFQHLYLIDGQLQCRKCAHLLYWSQALPDSSWRAEVARPILKAVRRKKT
jgi:hypothetical protein